MLSSLVAMALAASSAPTVVSARNVPIEPGTRRETVADGLEHPWAIAWLPDGTALITERAGRLRMVQDGRLLPDPVAGVPPVFAQNQGGLLDVSVHPRFAENGFVYLTYAHGTVEANSTRLARARLVGNRLEDLRVIFESNVLKPGAQHFGSRIAWLADGTMLVSIGDGGNPPVELDGRLIRDFAQDVRRHNGKVVRLNDDGTVPRDNPRFGDGAAPGLWSIGHRNIQGLAVDRARGTVWASEHGALGGDELNRLQAGANYGWPVVSRTREYRTGDPVGAPVSRAGMTDPALMWEVAVAPSGLALYDGALFPQWRGDLFSGSLVGLDVRRLDLDDLGRVVNETALRIGQRVRDVRQGPDGALWVLTDERAGRVLRFVPDAEGASAPVALPVR